MNVEEVHHITDTVEKDLTLLAKVGIGVEGLRERLDREAGVTLPGGTPEGRLSVTSEGFVNETLCKKIVICARHYAMVLVCVILHCIEKKFGGLSALDERDPFHYIWTP